QSSVTLFGRIGGGVRWVNGLPPGSQVGFNNNIIAGNEFGIRGREDLGNGLKALFVPDVLSAPLPLLNAPSSTNSAL
ncbi:porin, partial [Burkholderia cenocepacia]|nr:porin [Burkholderia cenocepacia]